MSETTQVGGQGTEAGGPKAEETGAARHAFEAGQVTVWEWVGVKRPSGHAGGGRMRHGDWLEAERAALARKGVKVEIRRREGFPQQAALFKA